MVGHVMVGSCDGDHVMGDHVMVGHMMVGSCDGGIM